VQIGGLDVEANVAADGSHAVDHGEERLTDLRELFAGQRAEALLPGRRVILESLVVEFQRGPFLLRSGPHERLETAFESVRRPAA